MRHLTRRSFVAGGTAAAISLALHRAAWAADANPYRNAIVIDGLGSLGNSVAGDGPLADAYLKDARDSGITCIHKTILPVGTTPPDAAFAQAVLGIGRMEHEIDQHPDVLCRIRTVADIAVARQSGRVGLSRTRAIGFSDGGRREY